MSYIEREKVISAVCFGCNQQFSEEPCEPPECSIRQAINSIPTADVVEVVRCKDCGMSRGTEDEEYLFCMQFKDTVDCHAFCSYGKRIEDRTHGTQRGQAQQTTDQASIWEKNMEFLRAGGFGSLCGEESQATLLRYWIAQEQAGYPGAGENVKYFAALTKGGTTLEKETH